MNLSFPSNWLDELAALDATWQGGDALTPEQVAETLALWRTRLQRPAHAGEEWFDIVDAAGEPLGYTAPRWLAHLTGLRHRVVHNYLLSPQGLLLLQMRAHDKAEWPSRFDTTVGGHLKAGQDWLTGALTEIYEEVGLPPDQVGRWLEEGQLQPVGAIYERYSLDTHLAIPLRNRQVNRLFSGQLTAWGLAHLRFHDGEVAGVFLCAPAEAQRMIAADLLIAPGLRHSFDRWWVWRRQNL